MTPEQIEAMEKYGSFPVVMNEDGSIGRMADTQIDVVKRSKIEARGRNHLLSGAEYEMSGKAWEQYGNLFR